MAARKKTGLRAVKNASVTFAREIPGEAMHALDDIEKRLADARANVLALESEKHAFLEALAPRCQLARIEVTS